MNYKPGHRYQLRAAAIRRLVAANGSLSLEHSRLVDQGFRLPRVTVAVARSGIATVRVTWSKKLPDGRMTVRVIAEGLRLT
jgi:hypothetical protein